MRRRMFLDNRDGGDQHFTRTAITGLLRGLLRHMMNLWNFLTIDNTLRISSKVPHGIVVVKMKISFKSFKILPVTKATRAGAC